jgi:predicted nuclease with TOPRIM domain
MHVAARRRKSEKLPATDETRAFTVVVEQMQGHFKAFGERLDLMDERLCRRLDSVDGRLDRVEGGLHRVEGRLDRVEGRLDGVDGRLDAVDGRLERIENKLDTKVDRDDVEKIVERVVARHAS